MHKKIKPMLAFGILIILFYIPANLMFMSFKVQKEIIVDKSENSIQVKLQKLQSKDDGTVDLVLNLKLKDILSALPNDKLSLASKTENLKPSLLPGQNPPPLPKGNGDKYLPFNNFPTNFTILLENKTLCQNAPDLQYIIYVHSAPGNWAKRKLLRDTWANRNLFIKDVTRIVFLLGSPEDISLNSAVKKEFQMYGDIVQASFLETYKNLTLKGILGLRWVSSRCSNAKFAIKSDDDAFVHIFQLMRIAEGNYGRLTKNLIVCPLWKQNTMPILRDPKKCMKWCVAKSEFPGMTHFPRYCAGLTFLLTMEVVEPMYKASFSTPFFWIDDVYVTGLLTHKLPDVHFIDLLNRFTLKETLAVKDYTQDSSLPLQFIFAHIRQANNFLAMWQKLLQRLDSEDLEKIQPSYLQKFKQYYNASKAKS